MLFSVLNSENIYYRERIVLVAAAY